MPNNQETAVGELSAPQKIAIVLASMGAENASKIYKHLSDDEVESISMELARMDYHPIETVEEVLNEFYELCLTQKRSRKMIRFSSREM